MKRYIFLIFTIFTLLFTGCNNLFENNSIESEKTSASDAQDTSSTIVSISGSINAGGAYPAEIAAALESRQAESVSRTAYPSLPATDLTIVVNAETTSTPLVLYSADVNWTAKTYTVGIPLPASGAKNYKITATIKWNNTQILYGESEAFDISLDSPLASKNLTVTPVQTQTGSGTIKLEVESESDSTIAKCKTSLSGDTVFTFSNNKTLIDIGSVSSGNQVIKIDLFDSSDKLLYSFQENINIFDNLQTNTWVKFGTEPWLVTSGSGSSLTTKCIITNAMVEGFKLTEIYVDPDATETTQSGTFLNPCLSLSAAISKLNHADKDYKIYINGSLTGPQEIPDTLTDTSEGSYHAKSVTIIGYNGLDDNGVPQDSLNGGFTSLNSYGVTLKINSTVPVIIKNLKITGGNHDGDGGGIYSIGKLTLDSGAFVCGNITDTCGGGVMNNGGELTIKSGAVIANNTSSGTNNNAYGGGGVYNYNGKLVMSGGQIKANTASQCGGGIYNAGLLSLCGNAYIPYGVDGVVGSGKNDFYLISGKKINITGKLTPPAECTDGIIAAITMSSYNGGDTLIEVATDASPATNVADESVRFKLTESGWKLFDNGKIGQQVFYIAAENSDDDYIGSDAKPLATFASLISKIKTQSTALNRKIVCEIIVKGDVESPNTNFDFESTVADSILLRGYNDSPTVINNEGTIEGITAKMNGKGSNTVLKIDTDVPVTIRNLLITGAGGEDHRGILMQKGTLVLDSGACISGNTCHVPNNGGWGGGIYQAGGVTTMKSGAYITKNWADGLGGGVALCGGTFNLNGGEISYNIQSLDADSGGGAGMYVSHGTNFYCNSGRITKNQLALRGGGSGVLRTFDYTNCTFASGNAADYIFDNIPGDRQYGSRGWE